MCVRIDAHAVVNIVEVFIEIKSIPDEVFIQPKGEASRAQVALIVMNYVEKVIPKG